MFSGNLDFLNDSLIQQSRFPLNAFSILYVRLGSSLAIFLYFHSKALFLFYLIFIYFELIEYFVLQQQIFMQV